MLPYLGAVFFSLFSLFLAARARSSTGNSVLVVLQPDSKQDNFAIFFDNLESKLALLRSQEHRGLMLYLEQGYNLTFRTPKDDARPIVQDDIPTFSHIILFAPDTKCENIYVCNCYPI